MGATEETRGRLARLESLPRASVFVLCGIGLTIVQTLMGLVWPGVGQQVAATVVIAGVAVAAELDRHFQEQEEAEAQADGRLPPAALAAERLAAVVRDTWTTEARRRGITTPAPASVRWRWGSREVAVPRGEVDLAGTLLETGVVTRLHDEVYAKLRRGRLVILGEPGAGKTGAMILLLLQALEHRQRVAPSDRWAVPVPVWLTLGGWDPTRWSLRDWLLTVLDRDHPYLRAASYGNHVASTLLSSGRLALFLDGLDEMPEEMRAAALRRLDAEAADLRIVLTSRPDEYRMALGQGRLHSAAVIEIRPVRPTVAASFMVQGEVGDRRDEWERVGQFLREHPESVAAQALSTPLMLSLARSAYLQADPGDLVEPGRFATPAKLRDHLVAGVMTAAYAEPKQRDLATLWLSWAAFQMGTRRDLSWWEIATWVPRWSMQVVTALRATVTSIVITLAGLIAIELLAGWGGVDPVEMDSLGDLAFALGVVGGIAAWLSAQLVMSRALRNSRPARFEVRRPRRGEYSLVAQSVAFTAVGLGVGLGLLLDLGSLGPSLERALKDGWWVELTTNASLAETLRTMLIVGTGVGVPIGIMVGLFRVWSAPSEEAAAPSPRTTYADDRRARRAMSALSAAVVGLSVAVLLTRSHDVRIGVAFGSLAAVIAAVLGRIAFGLSPTLRAAEYLLRAPRLAPLLEDALEREVLRRAGSVYQFRHAELQDHLARRYSAQYDGVAMPRRDRRLQRAERRVVRRLSHLWQVVRPLRSRVVIGAAGLTLLASTAVMAIPLVSVMADPDHVTLIGGERAQTLAFSPDGKTLAASDLVDTVLWDTDTWRRLHTLPGVLVGSPSYVIEVDPDAASLAFTPDGSTVATASGRLVRWWDVSSGEQVGASSWIDEGHRVLTFSPERSALATVRAGTGQVAVWTLGRTPHHVVLDAWPDLTSALYRATLDFSPDGSMLVTAGGGVSQARVWNVRQQEPTHTKLGSPDGGAAFTADGTRVLVSLETALSVYDVEDGYAAEPRLGVPHQGGGLLLSPGDDLLAYGDGGFGDAGGSEAGRALNRGGGLELWSLEDEVRVRRFELQPEKLDDGDVLFGPGTGHPVLVTAWFESFVRPGSRVLVHDLAEGGTRELWRDEEPLLSLAFSPDGKTLATGWGDGRVRILTVDES